MSETERQIWRNRFSSEDKNSDWRTRDPKRETRFYGKRRIRDPNVKRRQKSDDAVENSETPEISEPISQSSEKSQSDISGRLSRVGEPPGTETSSLDSGRDIPCNPVETSENPQSTSDSYGNVSTQSLSHRGMEIYKDYASNFYWRERHKKFCRYKCPDEETHYAIWKSSYNSYLVSFYNEFSKCVNSSKVNFDLFAEFVYKQSSGFISEYL